MSAQPAKSQDVIEVYELLLIAATHRQPVAAIYDGQPRLLCPHVLGRKAGRLHALGYQVGGNSNSGLPLTPEGRGVALSGCGETQSSRIAVPRHGTPSHARPAANLH